MTTFFMFGKYTTEAIREISIRRTEKVVETLQQLGGNVTGMYALLGEYDLMFCVNLPDVETAMKASLDMTRLTNISFITCPAVKVETFDRMAAK